jgi:hypothetical protein
MIEAIRSSETSILTTATWRHIPEDAILRIVICIQILYSRQYTLLGWPYRGLDGWRCHVRVTLTF